MAPKTLFGICFSVAFLGICCSGTLVGFSYDARRTREVPSHTEKISLVMKNGASSSQIKVSAADKSVLQALVKTGNPVHLYLNDGKTGYLPTSETAAISWLKSNLLPYLPRINITGMIFNNPKHGADSPHVFISALTSIQSALKTLSLDQRLKVLIEFPLSSIEKPDAEQGNHLKRIIADFRGKLGAAILVDTEIKGELSLGDQFVRLVMEKATSAVALLPYLNLPLFLNVKSTVFPSEEEAAKFGEKMADSMRANAQTAVRIHELFVEISPMEKSEKREMNREKEQIFPSSRRQLLPSSKPVVHDIITPPETFLPTIPITNPVTTPATVPGTPTPTIVTVPSTNPVTVLPTNPLTTPPVTNPVPTPITIPPANLFPPPGTVPVTNPVTTPPVTNPVTTYPFPPPGVMPVTIPVVPPPGGTLSPVVSGQSWCVAKMGVPEAALQTALDYACGIGGADCSAIQQGAPCYIPDSLRDHASYAFNSYYQKNPISTSCDFGGTAGLVNSNPSSGSCVYPSSSGSSSSSVLNPNNFTASTSIFGSQPPSVTTSYSPRISVSSIPHFALVSLVIFFM